MSLKLGAGGSFLPDENPEADAKVALPLEAPSQNATEAFERRARLAEDRLAEVLAAYRKLKSENEGYRDRITRNLERRFDQRRERLLLRFIEILDNLDRALEAAELTYAGNPLIDGLILVRTQLLQTLQEEGLERIPVVGLPYDPALSEAVETRPVSDPDQHHVVLRDLQRGYRLNGKVARASRVAVGEYGGAGASAQAPSVGSARNPFPLAEPPSELGGLVAPADETEALLDALEPVPDKKDDEKA